MRFQLSDHRPRVGVARLLTLLLTFALIPAAPARSSAQQVTGGDFDICDYCGSLSANTMHLRGRPGFGTNLGQFVLINAANDAQDVDRDGWTSGVNFTNLFVQQVTDFINVAQPSRTIASTNFVLAEFLNPLNNGAQNIVSVSVNIPTGTAAGIYRGQVVIADSVNRPGINANGEQLRLDVFFIEIEVVPVAGMQLLQADTAANLDSLVIHGRAGERASGVARVVNTGNTPLTDVRMSVSDLRLESAVNIVIPSNRITVSPPSFSSLDIGDTLRATVTVDIPNGILGGRYRGTLTVQSANGPPIEVPVVLIVTSSRGILFENNPVRNSSGVARIAFNGDPGTDYHVAIFDMNGLMVFTTDGTVFAGVTAAGALGTAQNPATGADFAVAVPWPLVNERGEGVASGTYLVVVESIVNGQRQLARDKLIVIR
ncbi:MAG TPA: hypothetical protein VJW73_22315 [Gemmatimonadaceae bacterium]|nr:hypothetical protein [Gemmatimonadaceae bacterium]